MFWIRDRGASRVCLWIEMVCSVLLPDRSAKTAQQTFPILSSGANFCKLLRSAWEIAFAKRLVLSGCQFKIIVSRSAEQQPSWKTHDRLVEIDSPWVKLICDRLEDNTGKRLDYWRVEKADSAIVLTLQSDRFLLPKPMYRPGIGRETLDFPGGRVPDRQTPKNAIAPILKRELGIVSEGIQTVTPLNSEGWLVNSSFSNQKLYGFVANLHPNAAIASELLGSTYPTTPKGIHSLLQQLICLQCRALLLEWQYQTFLT